MFIYSRASREILVLEGNVFGQKGADLLILFLRNNTDSGSNSNSNVLIYKVIVINYIDLGGISNSYSNSYSNNYTDF